MGLGGGIVFSHPIPLSEGWVIFGIGFFIFLYLFFSQSAYKDIVRFFWPGKQDWERRTPYDEIATRGTDVDSWRTPENQKKDDYFMLHIAKKNGKERVVSEIQFMQGRYPAPAYPLKYAVTVSNKRGIYEDWNGHELFEKTFGEGILIKFDRPIKVHHFFVSIKEPRPGYYWGIDEIRIQEVRLFGRLWKHTIQS